MPIFVHFANCKKMLFCYNSVCNEVAQRGRENRPQCVAMKHY
nr:MAG TPA: hypothetical protein [Caudoviricetes sp.]